MSETPVLHTKWGTAKLFNNRYYRISSSENGNHSKFLHRLIATDYFGDWINDPNDFYEIHHIDGDKTNNCVLNLEPLTPSEHRALHFQNRNKNGCEHPRWKNYARIIKYGSHNDKQRYAIIFDGKLLKRSINICYLTDWFEANYPNERLVTEVVE